MRFTPGGVRRAAAILTTAVAGSALLAGSANAQLGNPDTIGVWDIGAPATHDTEGARAVVQHEYTASADGYITDLGAAFSCVEDICGPVSVVVLRWDTDTEVWQVVKKSDQVTPDGSKATQRLVLPHPVRVQPGDAIGVELGPDTSIKWGDGPQGAASFSAASFSGPTKTFEETKYALDVMYNATFKPLPSVTTTFNETTTPSKVLAGTKSSFNVELTAPDADSSAPAIGGTVSLSVFGDPIAECQNLPVVNGKASCEATAPEHRTWREVKATYSGDDNYVASKPGVLNQWVIEKAKMVAKAKPNVVEQTANIGYSAEIENVYLDSVGPAGGYEYGTAAFFVDGQPVANCGEQPVDEGGFVKCPAVAPAVVGTHTLKVAYNGDDLRAPNSAETTFDVIGPAAGADPAVDFGTVAVGATESRTVTVTSTGKADLKIDVAQLKGDPAFGFGGTTCGDALPNGKTCEFTVTFKPTAGGAQTAKLVIAHNGGHTTVELSGTGLAPKVDAPVPPAPTATPTPTPTPTPTSTSTPKPGATLDPAKKTATFTVDVPTTAGGSKTPAPPTVKLPLTCPADTECELSGRLTIEESALKVKQAKASAAAAATTTVAKFSKVQVEAGGLKTVKLQLSKSFVKSAQKRGIRRIRATLTIRTVLGTGEVITNAQRITIVLPKAAKKVARKQQVRPAFTG